MLKRATAIILLFLALSPFTAPFSSWDGDNGRQIAPVESVFGSRHDAHGLFATSPGESGRWTRTLLAGFTIATLADITRTPGLFTRLGDVVSCTGDYPISTAVLRL
jgi:hypothetical protein